MKIVSVLLMLALVMGSTLVFSDVYASHSQRNSISAGSTLNLYLSDDDLNLSRSGFDTVSTQGLLEFTINVISLHPGFA